MGIDTYSRNVFIFFATMTEMQATIKKKKMGYKTLYNQMFSYDQT